MTTEIFTVDVLLRFQHQHIGIDIGVDIEYDVMTGVRGQIVSSSPMIILPC